jgi:type I protein arginine methyltransferase
MYSAHNHGRMIAHRVRVGSYRRALEKVVKPGAVVVDIGTGTGLFAIFACHLGARKVFAIESGEIIELARQIAKDNGCAERIEFIRDLSTRVELPQRADVIVADIHGTLPIYNGSLTTLIDARQRFLAPGGAMVPRLERIWTAAIDLPRAVYAEEVSAWRDKRWGVDLSAGSRFGTDAEFKATLPPRRVVTEPVCVATLDYQELQSPSVSAEVALKPMREARANGYGLWFDSELAEGVFMSTAPGYNRAEYAGAIYPNVFAPWPTPVRIGPGDEIKASVRFTAVKDDYVWQWNTRIEAADSQQLKAEFRQSNFNSRFVSAADLHKRAPTHRPRLSKNGLIARAILDLMGDSLTHAELAQIIMQQFPQEFRDEREALQTAADLAERFCE